jgi:hypothetical protein
VNAADIIWNRAAMQSSGMDPRPGDVALASVLHLHGLAMNGGLLDAIERLSDSDLDAAEDGYRWLGLDGAAQAVRFVRSQVADGVLDDDSRVDSLEQEADGHYAEVVPDDEALVAAFRRRLEQHPEAFTPA